MWTKTKLLKIVFAVIMVVGFWTVNFRGIANAQGLTMVSSINPGCDNIRLASDIVVVGNYAYLGVYNFGFYVIDVSDPLNPVQVGVGTAPKSDAYDIKIKGNYLYLADEDGWLVVFDISHPFNPAWKTSVPTTWARANNLFIVNNLIYAVGDRRSGAPGWFLDIFDISNPLSPTKVGAYITTEGVDRYAPGLYVKNGYAYVGHQSWPPNPTDPGEIAIVDVSQPTNPTLVTSLTTVGQPLNIDIAGDYLFVAESENGLHILNISNPVSPQEIVRYDTENVFGVTIAGDYAYLADRFVGLVVLDISNPAAPSLADRYVTGEDARQVFVASEYVFLTDGAAGLKIFDFTPSVDDDNDGYTSDVDCNDNDSSIYPGAPELCDGKDNDCNDAIPADETDADSDAFMICQGDCNDADTYINPEAYELPGNITDENCDGSLGACDPNAYWKNHGQFVRCVAHETDALIEQGVLTEDEGDALISSAAQSDVGKK